MEPVWETASERSGVESLSSAGGTTATEVPEEEEEAGGEEAVKVFVAVPEQHKHGKSTLAWALRHLAAVAPAAAANVVVVVAHVHAPAQMIPLMGSKFHTSKLRPEQVSAYRQYERGKVDKHLDDYIRQCSKMKVKGKKLVIQNEDIAKGITDIVSQHGVSKLVMGAAADKHYSRKMMSPKSKTALAVILQADPSCKIWFVCKEHLISTREAGAIRSQVSALSLVSANPNRYASRNGVEGCIQRSISQKLSPLLLPCRSAMRRTLSILSMEDISVGSWDSGRRGSVPSSCREEASSDSSSSFELPIDDVFAVHQNTASCHDQAKKSEDVSKQNREVDEAIAKANEEMKLLKQEMEAMRRNRDDAVEKLCEVKEEKAEMVAASRYLVDSQRAKLEQLEDERDTALERAEEMRMASGLNLALFSEFSLSELRQATRNFNDTMKIGEGGFGCVYRGVLRNTTVAVKMLHSQSSQGRPQFLQEVAVLSRVRHPNLVTLMGCCPDASALVYEFLPNGSLEDRLACRNNTPPLTWQVRTRIIGEVCSALVFLHSGELSVIHGDLKPANILLDANLVGKLGDLGASRLPSMTNPGSTPYTDPEYLTTGELTARSDVYSLGIVVLRLVTGQPALGIARKVEDALEKGEMEALLDRSAGEWPFAQAEKLMLLGLQCAEVSRRRRPERMSQVWRVVEPLAKAASVSLGAQSAAAFGEIHTPFYFICPISQEVMRNPHTAADGFTYESEAIKGWLDSGHDTSPMTKLALAHRHVTPNYALRSAIEDYMMQQQQQQQHQHQGKPSPQSVRSDR